MHEGLMNTPLIGRVKIALKRARLGISKAIVSEGGELRMKLDLRFNLKEG